MVDVTSIEAVEKALGTPVSGELSNDALKVRRNLLVFGLISIFIVIAEVRLDPTSTVLGFKFIGLTDSLVRMGLLLTTSYLFLHFLWYVYESFLEWRLRVTGTKLAFLTGSEWGSEHADYPKDPRQSTLYSWWVREAKAIENLPEKMASVEETVKFWEDRIRAEAARSSNIADLQTTLNILSETRVAIVGLTKSVDQVQKTLSAVRIVASLKRFDGWFYLFLRSQNFRWLLIDVSIPLLIGASAIFLLIKQSGVYLLGLV